MLGLESIAPELFSNMRLVKKYLAVTGTLSFHYINDLHRNVIVSKTVTCTINVLRL